jgi:hypothetical protein
VYYGYCLALTEVCRYKNVQTAANIGCYKEAAALNKHIYGIKQNKLYINVNFSIFVQSRCYYCPCQMNLEPCHIRTVGLAPVQNIKKVVSSGNALDLNFTKDTHYLDRYFYVVFFSLDI